MTFREWEKQFKKALKGISTQEKQTALEYYRELYGDKIDAGCSPEDAVAQFGNPIDCAQNIVAENAPANKKDNSATIVPKQENKVSTHSVSIIIGMVFLTLFLIIPIFTCLFAIVAIFGASAIACAVCAVASLLLVIIYPVYLAVYGAAWSAIVANIGMCLAAAGVCTVLAIALFFATKYMVIWSIKLFRRIYFKGDRV